jgi:hypothetical protein
MHHFSLEMPAAASSNSNSSNGSSITTTSSSSSWVQAVTAGHLQQCKGFKLVYRCLSSC